MLKVPILEKKGNHREFCIFEPVYFVPQVVIWHFWVYMINQFEMCDIPEVAI